MEGCNFQPATHSCMIYSRRYNWKGCFLYVVYQGTWMLLRGLVKETINNKIVSSSTPSTLSVLIMAIHSHSHSKYWILWRWKDLRLNQILHPVHHMTTKEMASCLNGQWGRRERLSMFWNLLPHGKEASGWCGISDHHFGATINGLWWNSKTTNT